MKDSPLVSIISVNYDQPEVTCEMLASLRKLSYTNVEILIVDNGSPKFDPQIIKDKFPEIQLIKSEKNLGFAGGNNLAIAKATGKYVFFLNNDTEVTSGCIQPLVDLLENNETAGVVSPKIIYFDSHNTIQYAGSTAINPWTGRNKGIGSMEEDKGQYDSSSVTALAHGAAMMVPRTVIDEVGMMPEIYFLYYEELDWCEMIKRKGFTCHYSGESLIYHKESISVGKTSLLKTYYINRNRLLFIRRNFFGFQKWSSYVVFLTLALPKRSLTHALHGEWKHCAALWKGLLWNITSSNKLPGAEMSNTIN